jgi:hypothetical protein
MKGKVIRVVRIVCSAFFVVKGRTHNSDQIVSIKLPVGILEAMRFDIVMMKQDSSCFPIPKIFRFQENESVPN